MAGKWAQKIQVGWESTAGTEANATQIWCGLGGMLADNRVIVNPRSQTGLAIPVDRQYNPALMAGWEQASTEATFEQLDIILSAGILDQDTGTADGSGSSGYLRTYPAAGASYTALNAVQPMTIEGGDDQQAWVTTYGICTSFTIEQRGGEAVMVTSSWIGQDLQPTTFTAALSLPPTEIISRSPSLFIDATAGTSGTTQISNNLRHWRFECTTGWVASPPRDDSLSYTSIYFNQDAWDATLTVTMDHDSNSDAEVDHWQAGTARLPTIKVLGSDYGTAGSSTKFSGKKGLQIDCAGRWENFGPIGEDEGAGIVEGTFKPRYVPADAKAFTIFLANEDAVSSS